MNKQSLHIRFLYVRKSILLGWVLVALSGLTVAQQATNIPVIITKNFEKKILKNELLVFDTAVVLTSKDAFSAFLNPNIASTTQTTSFGFSANFYWLYFTLENRSSETQNCVVVVNNPHINHLSLFKNSGENVTLVAKGGDGAKFMDRTFIDRRFIAQVQLKPNSKIDFALMVDKRHASISIPISIENEISFLENVVKDLFVLGVYFGAIVLIVVYALVVYFKTKEEIFFWYAFYILFLGLYLAAHMGLLFQYFYPNYFGFNDYARPVFVTWLSTGLVRFIQLLVKTKKYLPRMEWMYKWLLITLNIITLWWWFTPTLHDAQTIWFLNTQNALIFIFLVLVLVSAIATFKKQRTIVGFFFGAFLAVLAGGLLVILIEMGLISEDIFPINPILVGSMVEIIVFAMGLSYWMKSMNEERTLLATEIRNTKEREVESYLKGIEFEKQKISAELHDDIGSRLSHLKRGLEPQNIDSSLQENIDELNKTVRRLSHELAPPRFENDEFLSSIIYLTRNHTTDKLNVSFQVFDFPENLNSEVQKQVYRLIQSALSIVDIHGVATNVDIQMFYHDKELVLTIEDDGIGYNTHEVLTQNEISNMKSRAKSLNASIEISTSPTHGLSIMVTVSLG